MRLTLLSTLLFAGTSLSAGSALAAGELNLICAADVVICEQMQGDFQKAHDIKVNMVRMSPARPMPRSVPRPAIRRPTSGGPEPATRICRRHPRG